MFSVGKPVVGKNFYDRTEMKEELKSLLASGQNFMIKAPRRYGKTSLVKQTMYELEKDYLYLDIRKIPRLSIITEQIMEYAYEQAGIKGFFRGIKDNVISYLKNSKHSVKIKYEILEYSAEFFTSKREPFEYFLEALSTLEKVATELKKKFIIVFDEFQDVKRLNYEDIDFLEIIRGEIQHHQNVTYVFLGSIEHLMTQIFENKKSPFFNFCIKLKLAPFDTKELLMQLKTAFQSSGIMFENLDELDKLLHRLNGHPSNTILTMYMLLNTAQQKKKVILRNSDLDLAYETAYERSLSLVEQYIIELNNRANYHDVLYRLANKEKQELSSQAVNQVLKGLLELGYIARMSRGEYLILDGFLEEYLKRPL